eukprot:15444427-Alexandrium_andersonii.AAC.1
MEPKFEPRDLPRFGVLMDSGALLLNSGCNPGDLQTGWSAMETKNVDVKEAMDIILTMENEFEIFLRAHLATLWQHTRRLEYAR